MSSPAATPQPPPQGEGVVILDLVVADLEARAEAGRQKYGTLLKAHNGRDALMDAYQEVLDLAMYLRQVLAERESIAAQLALMASSIYQYYLNHGYHTFAYWIAHEPGEGILADALADFVEEHYPAEWRAAWEPYDNDPACLPRDPRLATTATEDTPADLPVVMEAKP